MAQLEVFRQKDEFRTGMDVESTPTEILSPSNEYDKTGMESEKNKFIRSYRFDKYIVDVKLDAFGEILGIYAISVDKDFLSTAQRLSSIGYIDTDKEYPPD